MKSSKSKGNTVSRDIIIEACGDPLLLMNIDEVNSLSDEELDPLLDLYGLEQKSTIPEYVLSSLKDTEVHCLQPTRKYSPGWLVPRENLAARVIDSINNSQVNIVAGHSGSGKSHLYRNELAGNKRLAAISPVRVYIDCFPLKMRSTQTIEQEAVYALFGPDEDGYRSFKDSCEGDLSAAGEDSTLIQYLDRKYDGAPGLLTLDHIESLIENSEAKSWLVSLIIKMLKRGIKVLLMTSDTSFDLPRNKIDGKVTKIDVGNLNFSEINEWASVNPELARSEISPKQLFRLTGGVPRIVRDFARFMVSDLVGGMDSGGDLLRIFKKQMSGEFSPEIHRSLSVIMKQPGSLLSPHRIANPEIRSALLRSGAFRENSNRDLRFASPLLRSRYFSLCSAGNLFKILQTGWDSQIMSATIPLEFALRNINASLMLERSPSAVFERVARIIERWKATDISIRIRDLSLQKLWACEFPPQERGNVLPLHADDEPEFAQSVQTGRIVFSTANKLFLPVASATGRIDIVISCTLDSLPTNDFVARNELRSLWNLVLSVQPALAIALERAMERRRLNNSRKYRYHPKRSGSKLASIMSEVGCSAVILLKKSSSRWAVESAEGTVEKGHSDESWAIMLSDGNTERLDQIANHPSRRGLLVDRWDILNLFPRLRSKDSSISVVSYICPVSDSSASKVSKLVCFAYDELENHSIDGNTQNHLKLIVSHAFSETG
ncbi:Uncharacterised protein [Halioglobus japonicus]|nr:Uncharacterised protein [Halioglobus japonicus]